MFQSILISKPYSSIIIHSLEKALHVHFAKKDKSDSMRMKAGKSTLENWAPIHRYQMVLHLRWAQKDRNKITYFLKHKWICCLPLTKNYVSSLSTTNKYYISRKIMHVWWGRVKWLFHNSCRLVIQNIFMAISRWCGRLYYIFERLGVWSIFRIVGQFLP